MKKLIILSVTLFLTLVTTGQRKLRIASVDMDYILEKLPEYQSALKELDARAQRWKEEIERREKEIKDLKAALEQEKVLLTKELLQEKEEEIAFKEKELLKYQLEKFGPEGDYILQKQHLVAPVQDRVFNAVAKLIKTTKYDIVFDKANDKLGLVYVSPGLDISDKVLKLISKEKGKEERNKKNKERKEKQEQLKNEAAKRRAELAAKRKAEREAKRKAALEARRKQREAKKNSAKKNTDGQDKTGKSTSKKQDGQGDKSTSAKTKSDEYGDQLTPEQLQAFKAKKDSISPQDKAAQRKAQREARRQRILEERRKRKAEKNKKNTENTDHKTGKTEKNKN